MISDGRITDSSISFWFDLFVNDQHNAVNRPFEWWTNTFTTSISEIGEVMLIMIPWNNPIILSRCWCLWEIYSTTLKQTKVSIAITSSDKENILKTITRDRVSTCINEICTFDVRNSYCFYEADKIQIHSTDFLSDKLGKQNHRLFS
jgi:hypothetical protein